MERWNHQGRAPRKRHRKRPPLRRRWRLTARRLKSGRTEKQLACLCVPDAWLQEISLHVNEPRNLVLAPVLSTLDAHQLVTRDFHAAGTASTGHGASRTTRSVTLPRIASMMPW